MDKALIKGIDSLSTLAQELGKKISELSPLIWNAYLKQQVVIGTGYLIGFWTFLFVGIISLIGFIVLLCKCGSDNDDIAGGMVFIFVLMLSCFLSIGFCYYGYYAHVTNPAYYAIQSLITTLKP